MLEIFVSKSRHVTIKHLKVVAGYRGAVAATVLEFRVLVMIASHVTLEHLETAMNQTTIKVEATNNLCVCAVYFQNATLYITDPTGDYMIMESTLSATSVEAYLTTCYYTTAEHCI